MRFTAFFKLYKICILLHRCNLKIFAKKSVWKNSNFREISAKKIANVAKFAKFCQISKISAWESGRFWKMLQNAYFLAKIGADTAENKQHFAEILPVDRGPGRRRGGAASFSADTPSDASGKRRGAGGPGVAGGPAPVCQAGGGLSWKIRYRILLWFFSQMIKLYKARSLLYRRQILQQIIRRKALDEIYKIYMLLHRSDINISENFRQTFRIFRQILCKSSLCLNSFRWFLFRFWWIFIGISPIC